MSLELNSDTVDSVLNEVTGDGEIVDAIDDLMSEPSSSPSEGVEVKFTTGAAGTGKTYAMKKAIEEDPKAGVLCATTGVAAVNLGTVTLNSILSFFDTESLMDQYTTGRLQATLVRLGLQYHALMIDEISMMEADQLDVITQATIEANGRGGKPLAIHLTGDFCQLPPVKGKFAFDAQHWPKYAEKTEKLTKIWRQEDPRFLEALNAARAGDASRSAEIFRNIAQWGVASSNEFEGTTILPKNLDVERYNTLRYMKLKGREVSFKSARWGKERSEWKQIPQVFNLKVGSYVMILSNESEAMGGKGPGFIRTNLAYANGDCGWIEDFAGNSVRIKLARNGESVSVPFITRRNESKEVPKDGGYYADRDRVYYDSKRRRWIYGEITYMPLRLAYAATVHKTQGLTLDAIQVDIRGHFFGSPAMAYVALSRVKTPAGLRIIGSPELLARRINVDERVLPWI